MIINNLLAQPESNKESCVVFGMPKVAIELNAASYVTPLASLADAILDTLESIGVGTRL